MIKASLNFFYLKPPGSLNAVKQLITVMIPVQQDHQHSDHSLTEEEDDEEDEIAEDTNEENIHNNAGEEMENTTAVRGRKREKNLKEEESMLLGRSAFLRERKL